MLGGRRSGSSSRRRRSSVLDELEEEREVFGESVLGVLEPRPGVGNAYWGVGQVLGGM